MILRIIRQVSFIILITAALAGGAWYYSNNQTPEYSSRVGLFIIQEQEGTYDPSVSIRSAEQIASVLSDVVLTEDFIDEIISAGFWIPKDLYMDANVRREQWPKIVSAQARGSFMDITIYHPNHSSAESLAAATAYVLTSKSAKWHGGGDSVAVKVVDTPRTSSAPIRPNTPLNTAAGAMTGLLVSVALIMYRNYFAEPRVHTTEKNSAKQSDERAVPVTVIKKKSKSGARNIEDINAVLGEYNEQQFSARIGVTEPKTAKAYTGTSHTHTHFSHSQKQALPQGLATAGRLYI